MDRVEASKLTPAGQRRAWARHFAFRARVIDQMSVETRREMSRLYAKLTENERAEAYRKLRQLVLEPRVRGGRRRETL